MELKQIITDLKFKNPALMMIYFQQHKCGAYINQATGEAKITFPDGEVREYHLEQGNTYYLVPIVKIKGG